MRRRAGKRRTVAQRFFARRLFGARALVLLDLGLDARLGGDVVGLFAALALRLLDALCVSRATYPCARAPRARRRRPGRPCAGSARWRGVRRRPLTRSPRAFPAACGALGEWGDVRSARRCCFSSSVSGWISSVLSSKSSWPDLSAWYIARSMSRNTLSHSRQRMDWVRCAAYLGRVRGGRRGRLAPVVRHRLVLVRLEVVERGLHSRRLGRLERPVDAVLLKSHFQHCISHTTYMLRGPPCCGQCAST